MTNSKNEAGGEVTWHPNPKTPDFVAPEGAVDAHCHVFGPAGEGWARISLTRDTESLMEAADRLRNLSL